MPGALAGAGRIRGAGGAGTCMAYQLQGRVLGGCSEWVLCPPCLSAFGAGLWAGFGAGCPVGSMDRSSRPACFAGCGGECGSSHRAWPVSSHPRSWRGASSSTRTRDIHPPGCASRTHWIRPGLPSPSLLAAGRVSLSHPLQPAKLPGPGSITHQDPAQHRGDAGGLRPRQHKEWL